MIVDDLSKHFTKRLHQLIIDTVDTCDRVDVDRNDTVSMVASCLMYEIVLAAYAHKMDEGEFLDVCKKAYVDLGERIKQMMALEKKARQRKAH